MSLGIGNSLFEVMSSGGTTSDLDTTGAKAIVLFVGIANSQAPFSQTDSEANSYTSSNVTGANYALYVFFVLNPTTNAAMTWSVTACSFAAIVLTDTGNVAFDSLSDAAFFDTTADPGSISVSSGAITLSAIASNRSNAFGSYTDPTGYTFLGEANTDTSFAAALQVDYNLSPGGTEQPLWNGHGFQGAVDVISFKPSGGGGGGGGNPWYHNAQQRVTTTLNRRWQRNGALWTPAYSMRKAA